MRIKWHLDPSSHLAIIHGPQSGGAAVPPFWGRDGSLSNTMSPGPRPTCVPSGILTNQPFGYKRHGPKIGGYAPLGRGSWVQCDRGRGLPPCQVSPWSIQPFGHNIQRRRHTDRTGRQRTDSIGRTVFINGCPKSGEMTERPVISCN